MIDTYNQFPRDSQIAVVGMRLFKQQNILYVVDGHCCFCNQEAANESHVFARNLPGKAMATDCNQGRHI